MAFKITDACIACGVCEPECPTHAITAGDIYIINPDVCVECVGFHDSSVCASVCPVDACVKDPAHVETKEMLLEKKNRIQGGK